MSATRVRSPRWFLVNVAIPLVTVVLLVAFVYSERDQLAQIREVPLDRFLFVFGLVALTHWMNSVEFWLLYRAVGARISITENWMLFTAGQLLNNLPAQVGTLYRFRYLKVVHGLGYGKATSGYGANLVVTIMATGLLGLAGSIIVGLDESTWSMPLLVIFVLLVAGSLATAIVPLPVGSSDSRLHRAWNSFREGWLELRRQPRVGLEVLGIEVVKYLITALRFQLTFGWVGIDAPYALYLILAPVSALATFVGPTPAGIGFRELSLSGAAVAMGGNFEEGLLGATVDRVVVLAVTIVLGGFGLAVTGPRLRRMEAEAALRPDVSPEGR